MKSLEFLKTVLTGFERFLKGFESFGEVWTVLEKFRVLRMLERVREVLKGFERY